MTIKEINKEVEAFMTSIGNPTLDTSIVKGLISYADSIGIPIVKWDKQTLFDWLKSIHAVSVISFYNRLAIFERYAKYLTDKAGLPALEIKIESSEMFDILDIELLLKNTITNEQYQKLLEKMKSLQFADDFAFDIRDRVIFELAWLGLTSSEIKYLKTSDITFSSNNGCAIMIVKTADNEFVAMDVQLLNDIRECIMTNEYVVITRAGVRKTYELLSSDYLIRPIKVGRIAESLGTLANPALSLHDALVKNKITCDDIDVENLTIENIKRSKIIYMLSIDHGSKNDIRYVAEVYDIKHEMMLYTLKKLSKMKYPT